MNEANIINKERIFEIKKLLEELHTGKSVEQVKEKYSEAIQKANPAEIAEAEGLLVQEGLRVEEIQKLCDLHLSVFKDSLAGNDEIRTIPGHPVFTFLAENKAAEELLDQISIGLKKYLYHSNENVLANLQRQAIILRTFEVHYLRKTQVLFPYLEEKGMPVPLNVMAAFQEKIIEKLAAFNDQILSITPNTLIEDKQLLAEQFSSLKIDMIEMFFKEAKILFPNAIRLLKKNDWGEILVREENIGYFRVLPRMQENYFQIYPAYQPVS